jgi:hypothetical protein
MMLMFMKDHDIRLVTVARPSCQEPCSPAWLLTNRMAMAPMLASAAAMLKTSTPMRPSSSISTR